MGIVKLKLKLRLVVLNVTKIWEEFWIVEVRIISCILFLRIINWF